MAKVSNAYTTYDATANREDLSDAIYNIDPYDTPFMSMVGRRNVSNVLFDWQTENLHAVDPGNAHVEGFELSRTAVHATVRLNNVCQISKKDATVSGTQDAANPAGKSKEMSHQMALRSKELKRDMETALCREQGRVDGDETTARKTRALESWLTTNVDRGEGGAPATDPTQAPTDGTQRDLTEDMLKKVMSDCYFNGAEPSVFLVGVHNKTRVSGFIGREQARENIDKERVQATVSLYAGDFGNLKIVPSRWIRQRSAFLIDPSYARVAYYRRFQRSKMAKIGDADTNMIVVEYGLQIDNEAAHGAIVDLNNEAPAPDPVTT